MSTSTTTGGRPRAGLAAVTTAVLLGLAGCGSSEAPASSAAAAAAESPLRSHVHGVGFDPEDGDLLVATHDGLFVVDDGGAVERVGPVIDLMGFVVDGPGRLLASGHPGPGVDLPQPVGLIESTDGGQTWDPLSRQGTSDFHSLTVGDAGVLGFDGQLRRSADGETWEVLQIPAPPAALAASPAGPDVLATTEQGLLRSTDRGSTWTPVDGAPLLQVVAWGGDGATVVGAEPSGQVWTSTDRAVTWQEGPGVGAPVQAMAVSSGSDGAVRIVIATTEDLVVSEDDGHTFEAVRGS